MTFTQIPEQYAPLGGELRYTVTTAAAETIDVRIYDNGSGALIGAKRFATARTASFDAAPYLRRIVRFSPTTGKTGFHVTEGRVIQTVVEAEIKQPGPEEGSAGQTSTVAPERIYTACKTAVSAPALLTLMPLTRVIARGESDELTLFSDKACTVTVTAQNGDTMTAESYRVSGSGVHTFRLNTNDFPEAETLTVDAGVCGTVAYTVIAAIRGSRRLAWRSNAGSVEHYTFPIEKSVTIEATKTRAYGAEGHLVAKLTAEHRKTLVSAYEARAVMEALGEILTSPDVWLENGDGYTPVDIVTKTAALHRHGAISCVEVEIRPKHKNPLSWN